MTTQEFLDSMIDNLTGTTFGESNDVEISRMESFEDAGMMTNALGFIMTLRDGSQHQITLVKSR